MAMRVQALLIGADVSKDEPVIYAHGARAPQTVANTAEAIGRYLDTLPGAVCWAVEATNTYHISLVTQAHARGHTVYLIDGYRLNRYRESVGGRAKTDAGDARLLVRYLESERDQLRLWQPPCASYTELQRLVRGRARLVQVRITLTQSLKGLPELKDAAQAALKALACLDTHIKQRLQAIEGIGEITAAALIMSYHRGEFAHSDANIAFIGMDVRVRDSGRMRGRHKLTKKGDPKLRRLLYLAAIAARRSGTYAPFFTRCLARGMTNIQALVALGRVAFALLRNNAEYQPKLTQQALP